MTTLHAQPYNIDACGFYFTSAEEYETKQEALRDRFGAPVEEFEIQFIDGDDGQLFEACRIHQGDLATWFDDIETLDRQEKAALFYLVDQVGYRLNEALEKLEGVCISECSLIDAASDLFDEIYLPEVPESVRYYIDYDAFAYACRVNGDMTEFTYEGTTYTCTNANGI
jgi:Antirestriction protein (ArdA)